MAKLLIGWHFQSLLEAKNLCTFINARIAQTDIRTNFLDKRYGALFATDYFKGDGYANRK